MNVRKFLATRCRRYFHFFFQFVLAAGHGKAMMPNVPLYDEFGDWATPMSLQRDIFCAYECRALPGLRDGGCPCHPLAPLCTLVRGSRSDAADRTRRHDA